MCRPDGGGSPPSLPTAAGSSASSAAIVLVGVSPESVTAVGPQQQQQRSRRRRWPCLAGRTIISSHPLSIRGGGSPTKSRGAGLLGLLAAPTTATRVVLLLLVLVGAAFLILLTFHRGFRRSVQFWTRVAPLVVEYKVLEWRESRASSPWIGSTKSTPTTPSKWLRDYHVRTAPRVVRIILDMGGIYIKIGQVMSTVGQAILPDEYVQALQPLQNGVTPRPYDEVRRIIERSTGRPVSSLFVEFDPTPIGSASIAQVHRARLAPYVNVGASNDGDDDNVSSQGEVVVKVQYPEVAQQFNADLANLELVTRILAPDQLPMIRALRQRHENELDFRLEASHLIECRNNLMRHWNNAKQRAYQSTAPLVTIPRVLNETGLCTQHVLVMEYLDGTPLAEVLEAEQVRLAKALRWLAPPMSSSSKEIDPKEARRQLTARLRKHYLATSEPSDDGWDVNAQKDGASSDNDDFPVARVMKRHGRLVQALAPAGLRLLHLYANVRDRIEHVSLSIRRLLRRAGNGGSGGLDDNSRRHHPMLPSPRRLNLARALKTLIRVHGLQLLRDGVYNADPHPGNVLVLPDGRLGLLDYGMVGRLSDDERRVVAQVVVALKRNERRTIADLYLRHGFRASFRNQPIRDSNVLHRFATFHLDKVDLSRIVTESGESLDLATLFRWTVVHSVPDWIAQARRLSGLLMGVTAQALRPVSLAHEWHDIAKHVLRHPPPPRRSEVASSREEGPPGTEDL